MFIWRLVIDKIVSYSELDILNYIDALKLSAIADYRNYKEQQQAEKQKEEMEETMRSKNG